MKRRGKAVPADPLDGLVLTEGEADALDDADTAVLQAREQVKATVAALRTARQQLQVLEAAQQARDAERRQVQARLDSAAGEGDVERVRSAQATLAAMDAVDRAQADRLEQARKLVASAEAGESSAAAWRATAERQLAALDEAAGGRWSRESINAVALERARRLIIDAIVDAEQGESFDVGILGQLIAELPEQVARLSLDDRHGFLAELKRALERGTVPEPEEEPWHWAPIVGPDGKIIGEQKQPGKAPPAPRHHPAPAPGPGDIAAAAYGTLPLPAPIRSL